MLNPEKFAKWRWDDEGGTSGFSQTGLDAVERKGLGNLRDMFLEPLKEFSGDLNIVHHPEHPTYLPWEKPNVTGEYSLTQVPGILGSLEQIGKLMAEKLEESTDLVVHCMDKRAARPLYDHIKREGGVFSGNKRKVFSMSWAGGPIQNVGDRRRAANLIADYVYEIRRLGGMPNLERVWAYGHGKRCGAVAYYLGEESLAGYMSKELGMEVENGSEEENKVMAALVRGSVDKWRDIASVNHNIDLRLGVVDIKHDSGKIDLINISPNGIAMRVEDLRYETQLRDAALRRNI